VPSKSKKSTSGSSPRLAPRSHRRGWPESVRIRAVAPTLTVDDLEASVAFYCDVLGFVVAERWQEAGATRGVRLRAGAAEFFLSQDDGRQGPDRPKGAGIRLLCSTVQEIDRLAEAIVARGGRLAQPPMDQLWGVRDLAVEDPDGFQITIYRPL
jgi:catechol 2,3-dioxygenase-like lactoylglutathione lyase family enzyme